MEPTIHYRVCRGPNKGTAYTPHLYSDGKYVVSRTRFRADQIKVDAGDIPGYLRRGFRLRMSDPVTRQSPSLISPSSMKIR